MLSLTLSILICTEVCNIEVLRSLYLNFTSGTKVHFTMSQSKPASSPALNAAIKAISEKISHLKVEVKALEDDHANQVNQDFLIIDLI